MTQIHEGQAKEIQINIKDLIKDNFVNFSYYRQNNFYYVIEKDGVSYKFPVPIEDIQDATLLNRDKAIYFMRYINKAIKDKSFAIEN